MKTKKPDNILIRLSYKYILFITHLQFEKNRCINYNTASD